MRKERKGGLGDATAWMRCLLSGRVRGWLDGAGLRELWLPLLDSGLVWSWLAWLVRARDPKANTPRSPHCPCRP